LTFKKEVVAQYLGGETLHRVPGAITSAPAAGSRACSSACTRSPGNIYTTETYTGKRLQRFVYKGEGTVPGGPIGVAWPM
jgi:hypothetical protein